MPARLLILGSASPSMVKGVSESLAGRVAHVDMGGLTVRDAGIAKLDRLWLRGGFPPSFTAGSDAASFEWRENLLRTILERDVPQIAERVSATMLRRFWSMLSHVHGQTLNASELGASLGVSHPTVRRYIDVLTGVFMVRQLQPWFPNFGKRLVKSPKVYLRDAGIFHLLQGIRSRRELDLHPKLGASWEGFAMEEVLAHTGDRDACFWAQHGRAELDLVVGRGERRFGFEFKVDDAPRPTRSTHAAIEALDLRHLWIVHPGPHSYDVAARMSVLALRDLKRALDLVAR